MSWLGLVGSLTGVVCMFVGLTRVGVMEDGQARLVFCEDKISGVVMVMFWSMLAFTFLTTILGRF